MTTKKIVKKSRVMGKKGPQEIEEKFLAFGAGGGSFRPAPALMAVLMTDTNTNRMLW